jgi:hypothetical protein
MATIETRFRNSSLRSISEKSPLLLLYVHAAGERRFCTALSG